uniref:ThiF family adenylyltransferase n=1 Tax=Nonomuraea pusilla TaxID=46177 RepID=UPI00159C4A3C|nr:ThiF family adenylyltransferase [Nonomuraea pusilla]
MRPRVKPALRRILRDERTLQFGVHPLRAVVLTSLARPVRRWIESLDGTRDLAQAIREAAAAGLDEQAARALLDRLAARGVLHDASTSPAPLRDVPLAERDRLRPDLDALDLASTAPDGWIAGMARRRRARVRVYGAGRVGAQVVALLAASGVGDIRVFDQGPVRPRDITPGGLTWSELGLSRQDGAVAVARRLTSAGSIPPPPTRHTPEALPRNRRTAVAPTDQRPPDAHAVNRVTSGARGVNRRTPGARTSDLAAPAAPPPRTVLRPGTAAGPGSPRPTTSRPSAPAPATGAHAARAAGGRDAALSSGHGGSPSGTAGPASPSGRRPPTSTARPEDARLQPPAAKGAATSHVMRPSPARGQGAGEAQRRPTADERLPRNTTRQVAAQEGPARNPNQHGAAGAEAEWRWSPEEEASWACSADVRAGGPYLGDGTHRPDLVVLAPVEPLDGLLVNELLELGIPHLLASAFEGHGSVGPLVLPGRTACLHCLDLARRDRDPGWAMVTARLGGFPPGEIACGTALATLVAAEAAGHVLAYIDGQEPAVTNRTVDVMPDWHWKSEGWSNHPQCRCMRNNPYSLKMVMSPPVADTLRGRP